jgi:hypothetical protein
MKNRRVVLIVVASMIVLVLAGGLIWLRQRNSDSYGNNSSGPAKTQGDFSTPRAVVETLIKAAVNRDVELISLCFRYASGEFRPYRQRTATQQEMDSLATFWRGAKVVDVKSIDEKRAQVIVKLLEGDEKSIAVMRTEGGDWTIVSYESG